MFWIIPFHDEYKHPEQSAWLCGLATTCYQSTSHKFLASQASDELLIEARICGARNVINEDEYM